MTTFQELGLAEPWINALTSAFQIEEPMPIQVAAFTPLSNGESVLMSDRTGSGKTLAYILPILNKINPDRIGNRLLIVTPTQELAVQIHQTLEALVRAGGFNLQQGLLIGGANIRHQMDRLKKKPQVLIGTPGRILDLFDRRKINGQSIETVIFDEVDELLSTGSQAIRGIQKALLRDVQQIAVSASPGEETITFFESANRPLKTISTAEQLMNPKIRHFQLIASDHRKFDQLRRLLHALTHAGRTLVFLNQPDQITRIVERLHHHDLPCASLHSEMTKQERAQAMKAFRTNMVNILVTSDVSARGLDFPELHQVVHLDFPLKPLTYVHRAGRTARGHDEGASIVITEELQSPALRIYAREFNVKFQNILVRNGQVFLDEDTSHTKPQKKSAKKKSTKQKGSPRKRRER